MFKSNIRIALRGLLRRKTLTATNILGLSVGLACCCVIMLWVERQLSWDGFHQKGDLIYRVIQEQSASTPPPLGPSLKESLPEIVDATRYRRLGEQLVLAGGKSFTGQSLSAADHSFFDMFSFPLVEGNNTSILNDPSSVVLTESSARRFFGEQNPVNKKLKLGSGDEFYVAAVMRDIPQISHLQFDLLIPFEFLKKWMGKNLMERWDWWAYRTYVQMAEGSVVANLEKKITDVANSRMTDGKCDLALQPLRDIHYNRLPGEPGTAVYVYIFMAIAVLVLLVAGFNFVNLSVAHGSTRMGEVGLRKIIGATRGQLIRQFLWESIIEAAVSVILCFIIVSLVLPGFSSLTGVNLSLDLFDSWQLIPGALGVALLLGFMAGVLPAVVMSSYKPVSIIGNRGRPGGRSRSNLRRIMVFVQFAASAFLLIGAAAFTGQLDYISEADLGYQRNNIITMPLTGDYYRQIKPLLPTLLQHPGIESATVSANLPGRRETTKTDAIWPGKNPDEQLRMEIIYADYEFPNTFEIKMVEGRYFSPQFPSDGADSWVINETAARAMGLEKGSTVGQTISIDGRSGKIVGVVSDFHSRSLHNKIEPLAFDLWVWGNDNLSFRLNSDDLNGTLRYMQEFWKRNITDYPFDFTFFDEQLDGLYRDEQRMKVIAEIFAGLAMFISIIGLIGLAVFSAQSRTREIGIRKVLGATTTVVIRLLCGEMTLIVIMANVLAWPAAYLAIRRWLSGFAYHMNIGHDLFLVSGGLLILISIIVTGPYALKIANLDPVKTLRTE